MWGALQSVNLSQNANSREKYWNFVQSFELLFWKLPIRSIPFLIGSLAIFLEYWNPYEVFIFILSYFIFSLMNTLLYVYCLHRPGHFKYSKTFFQILCHRITESTTTYYIGTAHTLSPKANWDFSTICPHEYW